MTPLTTKAGVELPWLDTAKAGCVGPISTANLAHGVDVPIKVGLAGPAGLVTLARYAIRCGIGNSLRVLTEKPFFAKLLVDQGPAPIIREIACAADTTPLPLAIAGLHFFAFGGFNKTVDWINAELGR